MGVRNKICLCISLMIAIMLTSMIPVSAQPKSLGANFSFTGFTLSYEHDVKKGDSFLDLSLKVETTEVFSSEQKYPGVSASLTWNIYIKEWTSRDGNPIRLFAGPGVSIGYGPDFKTENGIFFGLKGRVGVECSFARDITLSVSMMPMIGSHAIIYDDHVTIKYYRNGIQYSLVPEIGIKYNF